VFLVELLHHHGADDTADIAPVWAISNGKNFGD
jgi:hypothetical protein